LVLLEEYITMHRPLYVKLMTVSLGLVHLTRDGTGHCIFLDIERTDNGIRESLFMAMTRLRV